MKVFFVCIYGTNGIINVYLDKSGNFQCDSVIDFISKAIMPKTGRVQKESEKLVVIAEEFVCSLLGILENSSPTPFK